MDDGKKRVHYFHAYADAFGGRLEQPFEQVLPVLAPSSLPVVGGYASARQENFRIGELISIDRAYTQVSGSVTRTGSFLTLVTAVIEGVNIDNVFFADRIAMQLSTDHPAEGYFPRVSFVGTEFRHLRLGGCELEPILNLDLCSDGNPWKYPTTSCLYNQRFRLYAQAQSKQLGELSANLPSPGGGFFDRFRELHSDEGINSNPRIEERGNILCSVVEGIEVKGRCPGTTVGHVIEIPEFGKIFLGELIVDHGSFDLTMIRLDMGCPTAGSSSGGHGGANGTSMP